MVGYYIATKNTALAPYLYNGSSDSVFDGKIAKIWTLLDLERVSHVLCVIILGYM